MTLLFKMTAALFAGTVLGLFGTSYAVRNGFAFEQMKAGPWVALPRAPVTGGDPYARAQIARTAMVPLHPAEGLAFVARNDSDGVGLDARCIYTIEGAVPQARLWTVSLLTADGSEPAGGRRGFTSAELVREDGGRFAITLARPARSGNYLALPQAERFALMLRLYDTPGSLPLRSLAAKDVPVIRRETCG